MAMHMASVAVKTEVDDGILPAGPRFPAAESISAADDIDHLSLKDRLRLLLSVRPSGPSLVESVGRVPMCHDGVVVKKEACFIEEVSSGDAHAMKASLPADSRITKEPDSDDCVPENNNNHSTGSVKTDMSISQINDTTCSYHESQLRAAVNGQKPLDADAGKELLHSASLSFPIQMKVEELEDGVIGSCSNVSGSFPNADIAAVKVKIEILDELHGDWLDHVPLQERMKMLASSWGSNLNFSEGLNFLQQSVPCNLEHDSIGVVDAKASGLNAHQIKEEVIKVSLESTYPLCFPGSSRVQLESESSCLTFPEKRKQIRRDLREKAHGAFPEERDPIDSANAKANCFSLRRKRKKTATDSIETALEEDAPGLLQVLIERGIKVDELKLYGDVEDEDSFDISSNEDGFAELETVITKLFSQPSTLLKLGPLRRIKGSRVTCYCLACLVSLIEQIRYLQFRKWPVEWGWCRELQSFIFIFEKHNRIVVERPEYGYATYFFKVVESLPINWQIKRLVTTMKLESFSRTTLIENKPLLVGEDLTEGEAKVLEEYGWMPNSGLGTMLHYCDRVVHDRKNEGDISEWRCKIGKLLMDGYDGGSVVLFDLPKNLVDYAGGYAPQVKLEADAEIF